MIRRTSTMPGKTDFQGLNSNTIDQFMKQKNKSKVNKIKLHDE